MRKNQSSIVLLGHDEHLLATRQWVLQTRGYRVLRVQDVSAVDKLPLMPPVRLLVLCHTLSKREREDASAAASIRWPGVKCLTLAVDPGRAPSGILGQLLHTMDGPAKLLSMVTELVGSSADLQSARQP
jgi:hypothetical protein